MLRRSLLTVLFALLLPLVPAPAHAAPEPAFAALGTPYVDVEEGLLRFGEGSVPFGDGLESVAQSERAAYVDDGRTLTVVPADGTSPRVLERRLVALPIADPLGRFAVWTARTDRGLRLRAYDDRTGRVTTGPLVAGRARVFAVHGRTALLVPRHHGPTTTWRVGGSLAPVRGVVGFVSDVHDGLRLEARRSLVLVDRAGRVLDRIAGEHVGTFSPDGRSVAVSDSRLVHDLDTGTTSVLRGLGREEVLSSRWTPGGDLVVHVGDVDDDYDDANPMARMLCRVPERRCTALPGSAKLFHDPAYESSAMGVFQASIRFS